VSTTPTRITHLIAGSPLGGRAERTSPVYNPATGEQTGVLDLATPQLVDEVVRSAKAAWENEWQHSTLTKRTQILFKFRELLNERKDEIAELITAEHGKVSPTRSVRSPAWPRGRRVRLRHPAPAQGRLLRERLDQASTSSRSASRSVWSPSSARSTSRRWCRCGSCRSPSPAATPSSSSRPRRTRRPSTPSPSCGRRPVCPTGVLNVVHGDKEAVDALLEHPDVKAVSFVGSTPIAKYVYETGTATASASRPSVARRTTCSSCPTPTSTSPPTPPSTPASARPVSAAWRSRPCSRSSPSLTSSIDKIKDRMGKLVTGDGTRGPDMGPLVTKAPPRQGRVLPRRSARGRCRPWSSTVATATSTPTVRATSCARRCSTRSPGHADL
jgi:malonate-semialdehyde dehydrogenase (acetylating)/methylmalonate-semialdehyde dehydrogenase